MGRNLSLKNASRNYTWPDETPEAYRLRAAASALEKELREANPGVELPADDIQFVKPKRRSKKPVRQLAMDDDKRQFLRRRHAPYKPPGLWEERLHHVDAPKGRRLEKANATSGRLYVAPRPKVELPDEADRHTVAAARRLVADGVPERIARAANDGLATRTTVQAIRDLCLAVYGLPPERLWIDVVIDELTRASAAQYELAKQPRRRDGTFRDLMKREQSVLEQNAKPEAVISRAARRLQNYGIELPSWFAWYREPGRALSVTGVRPVVAWMLARYSPGGGTRRSGGGRNRKVGEQQVRQWLEDPAELVSQLRSDAERAATSDTWARRLRGIAKALERRVRAHETLEDRGTR